MAYYIGLDLGGTNIKAGVVDDQGRVLAKTSIPTGGNGGQDAVIQNMVQAAQEVVSQTDLTPDQMAAVGIGTPGPIDVSRGILKAAPNLPALKDVPICSLITQATDLPAVLENDANAAAFGEYWIGAGGDSSIHDLIMLTLGTGIGTGLIVDGQLLHGGQGTGGEGGHMIVVPDGRQCNCGQRGCLETYASASHTAGRALEAIHDGEATSLREIFDLQGDVTAKDVFKAARAGDPLATRITDETAKYLGVACVNLCRLFDPQMIVFAGGMILAGDFLFDRVRTAYARYNWHLASGQLQIVPARLGNDAGLIGAAAVARDAYQNGRLP